LAALCADDKPSQGMAPIQARAAHAVRWIDTALGRFSDDVLAMRRASIIVLSSPVAALQAPC
jgi:hypothetical protein